MSSFRLQLCCFGVLNRFQLHIFQFHPVFFSNIYLIFWYLFLWSVPTDATLFVLGAQTVYFFGCFLLWFCFFFRFGKTIKNMYTISSLWIGFCRRFRLIRNRFSQTKCRPSYKTITNDRFLWMKFFSRSFMNIVLRIFLFLCVKFKDVFIDGCSSDSVVFSSSSLFRSP